MNFIRDIITTIFMAILVTIIGLFCYIMRTLKIAFFGVQKEDLCNPSDKAEMLISNIFAIPFRLFVIFSLV